MECHVIDCENGLANKAESVRSFFPLCALHLSQLQAARNQGQRSLQRWVWLHIAPQHIPAGMSDVRFRGLASVTQRSFTGNNLLLPRGKTPTKRLN